MIHPKTRFINEVTHHLCFSLVTPTTDGVGKCESPLPFQNTWGLLVHFIPWGWNFNEQESKRLFWGKEGEIGL